MDLRDITNTGKGTVAMTAVIMAGITMIAGTAE
jgi:hypothetical protein